MSAKLDYVMDELLDARKLWDSPRFLQFAIEDTVPEEGATEADVENAIRILATERRIVTEGGDLCFIRIRPDGMLFTYAMGMSVLDVVRRPRGAIGRVAIPAGR